MNDITNRTNTPPKHSKQLGTTKASGSTKRPSSSRAATQHGKPLTRLSAAKNTTTASHHKNTKHPTNPNKEWRLYAPNTPLGFLFPWRLSGVQVQPTTSLPHLFGSRRNRQRMRLTFISLYYSCT